MREIRADCHVAATPHRVWEIVSDFESYAEWNPFITHAEGRANVGAMVRIETRPPGKRPNTINARVLVAKAPVHLRWEGIFVNPLLFSGTHIIELAARDGGTRVVNREEFRGLLAPLLLRFLGPSLPSGYAAMNTALKARAERSA